MTHRQAQRSIRKLLAGLPPLAEVLRGSLLERHTFHPPTVACATCSKGQGHHQWVLNINYPGGKTRQISLHPDQVAQVRQRIANLDGVRQILEQICEVNQQLLPIEREQQRSAQRG
jgi:uncharacterized protein DUF6788